MSELLWFREAGGPSPLLPTSFWQSSRQQQRAGQAAGSQAGGTCRAYVTTGPSEPVELADSEPTLKRRPTGL